MKRVACLLLAFGALGPGALAEEPAPSPSPSLVERVSPPVSQLSVRVNSVPSTQGLTTEHAWTLDPGELNPHRARWIVRREVRLAGLEAVRLPSKEVKRYGIQATGIESFAEGWMRDPGPWYLDPAFAPCQDDPERRFATRDGTRKAMDTATDLWEKTLHARVPELVSALRRISAEQPYWALNRAVQVYSEWLRATENAWRARAYPAARQAEWSFYRESGILKGCRKSKPLPIWREMLEPVPAQAPVPSPLDEAKLTQEDEAFDSHSPGPKPRLRAPARRWDGAFSVRGDLLLADVHLSGQWLIDSGAPESLVSSTWEAGQGIPTETLEIPGALDRYQFTADGGGQGLAPRIQAEGLRLSRERFDFSDFLLRELDLFGPPKEAASCCDAILGADFLARQVVELAPAKPAQGPTGLGAQTQVVRIWPKEGFSPPAAILPDAVWVEAYYSNERVPTSVCDGVSVRWESGSGHAWRGSRLPRSGRLSCQGIEIAHGLTKPIIAAPNTAIPGVGMPVLGRGPVIFDMPHGRIWFSKSALAKSIPRDRSGFRLRFLEAKDARPLQVVAMEPGSPAAKFAQAMHLPRGAILTRIAGKDAEELDLWEVQQILSGSLGDEVPLEWRMPGKVSQGKQVRVEKGILTLKPE